MSDVTVDHIHVYIQAVWRHIFITWMHCANKETFRSNSTQVHKLLAFGPLLDMTENQG